MKRMTRLWIAVGVLVLLSPLGILIPACFQARGAWGEWEARTLGRMIGYVPPGLKRMSGLWNAPLPHYGFPGTGDKGFIGAGLAYLVCAAAGSVVITGVFWVLGRVLVKKEG